MQGMPLPPGYPNMGYPGGAVRGEFPLEAGGCIGCMGKNQNVVNQWGGLTARRFVKVTKSQSNALHPQVLNVFRQIRRSQNRTRALNL